MKTKRLASTVLTAIALAVPALAVAAPAHADPDTDFYNELHIYGIYGEKDYNAWIGKITCKRLWNNLDHDAYAVGTSSSSRSWTRTPPPSRPGSSSVPRFGRTARTSCRYSSRWRNGAGGGQPPAPEGPPLAAEQ